VAKPAEKAVQKVDFKKTLDCYRPGRNHDIRMLVVPPLQYLMVDGRGDPNTSPEFAAAVEALYPIAYRLKFASKKALERDYVVMPLEGLWWADDLAAFTAARDKAAWRWTLMIMVPDWITGAMLDDAVGAAGAAGGGDADGGPAVRLETLDEGLCAQTLHVGPFDDEAGILRELHEEFVPASGHALRGTHHEIYLSDRRKTEPAKLRTILRQPIEPRR
jgi:hypothetical protein